MSLTFEELKQKLIEQVDEVTLLDVLGITAEQLLTAFSDEVEDKREQLLDLIDFDDDYVE